MLKKSSITTILLLVLFFEVIFSQNAQAYLDPGTGSFIVQIIIASLMGLTLFIKTSWRRLKAFFTRISLKKKAQNNLKSKNNA